MKHDERIPIEPLSDASWSRIEHAVFEELDDRARTGNARPARTSLPRWAIAALTAAMVAQLAVAAVVLWNGRSAPETLVTTRFTSGATASDGLIGDVAIALEPGSALVVVDDAKRNSLCVLERGAVRFSVPERGARPAFVVQAGDVRVEVIGTQFRVERIAGSARVATFEGKVRVSARGQTRLLTRGQSWSPSEPSSPAAAPAPAAEPDASPSEQPGRVPAVRVEPPAAEAATAEAQPLQSPEPAASQRARFEQAAAREATGPQHALRIYRALAQEHGPWAQNALYASARLELELGHHARAERALRSYLKRFPAGANAADARALLQRMTREKEQVQP